MSCNPDLGEIIPDKIEIYNLRGVSEALWAFCGCYHHKTRFLDNNLLILY